MAVTIAVSFILIIPIEPIIWLLAIPSGLLIGYYANQRSDRRAGPWSRILRKGVFAGAVTGPGVRWPDPAAQGDLLLRRHGYPDFNRLDPATGQVDPADLLDRRRLRLRALSRARPRAVSWPAAGAATRPHSARSIGSNSSPSPGRSSWSTTAGGLGGAVLYGLARPKPTVRDGSVTTPA